MRALHRYEAWVKVAFGCFQHRFPVENFLASLYEKFSVKLLNLLALAGTAATTFAAPRYENVVSVRVTTPREATCYSPKTGHYPCIEVGVIILHRMKDGRVWSVSTSYKFDGTLISTIQKDFGDNAKSVLRNMEPALQFGKLGTNAAIKKDCEELLSSIGTNRHYQVNSDVVLSIDVEAKVNQLAEEYFKNTKQELVVTSGTRTSESQAEAMFTKLELGDDVLKLYKNTKAAEAIKKKYDELKKAEKDKAEIIAGMTEVISSQIKEGVHISNHLKSGAVDVRSKDMTAEEKDAFLKAIGAINGFTVGPEETKPPHFHLDVDVTKP